MEDSSTTLKWSTQLHVAANSRTPKLVGDKITLPQTALEALLAAAPVVEVQNGFRSRNLTPDFDPFNPLSFVAERRARGVLSDRQQQLPHPLTFRIVNPQNGRAAYAGIREFSADDGQVGLSAFLKDALGFQDSSSPSKGSRSGTPSRDIEMVNGIDHTNHTVTVHAQQLQKGTYVRLRPLEAGYDPEDWKSLLERYLRDNFTTLTKGEILDVPGARHEHFRFLVDKFEPEADGICIVDTDLEVDIEPLNEEQAKETLQKMLAKKKKPAHTSGTSSSGGVVSIGEHISQVIPGDYVDYEIRIWDRGKTLEIYLETADESGQLDIFVSPFSAHHRSRPREDESVFAQLYSSYPKCLSLSPTNVDLEGAESLYVSIRAWNNSTTSTEISQQPVPYTLRIASTSSDKTASDIATPLDPDEVICKNCQQHIPKRTLPLHEAFCYRNNVRCPQCSSVFLKSSQSWKDHWHCPHDEDHGNSPESHTKHDFIFHPPSPLQCPNCDFQAFNIPILAQHRTSTCPGKEILCQFCHLVVPQQGPDDLTFSDPEVILSGLTPHELTDGARTTECHLCNKIVRLRDMKTHLRLHDRDRLTRPKPKLCANTACRRTLKPGDETRISTDQLGLCNDCFGPLYVATYDPDAKMLRRRVERRLLHQLVGGCGKPWCRNEPWCKTAHRNVTGSERGMSTKDALVLVRPVMDALARDGVARADVCFCVDEATQIRRNLAEMLAAEGEYEMEWCVKALEEEKADLTAARQWLKDRAPRIGEVV